MARQPDLSCYGIEPPAMPDGSEHPVWRAHKDETLSPAWAVYEQRPDGMRVDVCEVHGPDLETQERRARLIQAAPRLMAACEQSLRAIARYLAGVDRLAIERSPLLDALDQAAASCEVVLAQARPAEPCPHCERAVSAFTVVGVVGSFCGVCGHSLEARDLGGCGCPRCLSVI